MLKAEKVGFKRILCPVNQSGQSSEALRYAIALADAYAAKLFVLHCIDSDAVTGFTDRAHIEQVLENLVGQRAGAASKLSLNWEQVIIEGAPDIEISRAAAELRIDLIVMQSRRRPYAAALLGSVAESVCRTSPSPILVTHARERGWFDDKTTNDSGPRRVLVAYDFSSDSELALSYAVSLAQKYRAELDMLHVVPARPRQTTPEIAGLPLAAPTAVQNAVGALKTAMPAKAVASLPISYSVSEGHPYREVLTYAEECDSDLICMGASGTGFGMRALFGSNVDRVLRQSPCPILIARPLRPIIAEAAIQQLHTEAAPRAQGARS